MTTTIRPSRSGLLYDYNDLRVRNLELEGGSLYDYSDPRVGNLELEARGQIAV